MNVPPLPPLFTTGQTPETTWDPYLISYRGKIIDPYYIADLYKLPSAMAQALKKLLRAGAKHKTRGQDLSEVISSCNRWLAMHSFEKCKPTDPDSLFIDAPRIARAYRLPSELYPALEEILASGGVSPTGEMPSVDIIIRYVERCIKMDAIDESEAERSVINS